jgi:thymidylate synthase ThyX
MITAKILADSKCSNGKRITTFELEYPRFIHAEFMTHRMVSKNAASSRAIPVETMIKQVIENPAMPVYWGKNQAGMAAKEELSSADRIEARNVWLDARHAAIDSVRQLVSLGLHKQIANRILEPWAHIKVVATATEWDNFFHLRRHPDAQPEIQVLANAMWDVYSTNTPEFLYYDEYHLPYLSNEEIDQNTLEDCIKLSASLCAQVSYRKADESIEKAKLIYDRLVASTPVHASPFEHQATPAMLASEKSGNFNGWIQYRQKLPNNVCNSYKP